MIAEFPHHPPKGYSYEFEEFKRGVVSIWLCCHRKFVYNGGAPTKTIWGFYNSKKGEYYAPINASKCGDMVNIQDTSPYSAMQLNITPLERYFV